VILFGAHSHPLEKSIFIDFMQAIYRQVAAQFPGHVFWFEPFPQHFRRGLYIDNNETECVPMTAETNRSQFWRVEVYNEIVRPTDRIHRIPVYNIMAPLWDFHVFHTHLEDPAQVHNHTVPHMSGSVDCTHYTEDGDAHALTELYKVVRAVREQPRKSSRADPAIRIW